jgi:hypothetical protein
MEDIDLELGQGKEGQQNHQEKKAARPEEETPPPPAKWNWKWKDEAPFLWQAVLYMALGVVIVVVFVYRTDDAVARQMLLWVGGSIVVFLRFVAGIFKSLLAT